MRIPEHSLVGASATVPSAGSSSQPSVGRTLSDAAQRPVLLSKVDLQKDIEARQKQRTSLTLAQQERAEELPAHRLFIVSARLPFTVIWNEEQGTFDVSRDPFSTNIVDLLASAPPTSARGGPAGGVRPPPADRKLVGQPRVLRKSDGNLVAVTEDMRAELEDFLRSKLDVVPVFLPPNRDRFADRMIWPLFHYSLPSAETGLGFFDWEGYELVNKTFRDAILNEYRRGDLVWINDYPLMLLPKLLRLEMPDIPIGFYLHCVFPSSEVYRILPQREEILRGVLSSNIVGFHNFEYGQQFLNSCIHILGLECSASCIEACEDAGGTTTKVVTVPLGIDIEPYQQVLNQSSTSTRMLQLQQTFETKKLLVALDRLEEKKGIPHKIMAFHKFLQTHPDWAAKCVLVQIVETFASEESVGEDAEGEHSGEQQRLLQQVYQMVGEVNSKFGTIGHLPVHFLCQEFSKTDLVALFAKAHVMFDTPLRDVLSQSAHEFLCCQEEEKQCGVLILSEFSGSAQSLRAAALTVNPWDTNAFADAIQEALEMDMHDRAELHRYGRKYVHEYTLRHWATNFLDELQTAERECETERLQIPPQLDHDKPVAAMRKGNRRLIILGYSGTLVPHKSRLTAKIHPKLQPVLLGNLQVIAEDPNTQLVIISGLPRDKLSETLGSVKCWIIGEGGTCYREPSRDGWHESVEQRDTEWLGPVTEIMEYFTARTPGSNIISMSSSVSWLYQNTQGDHAAIQSKDLLVHLWAGPLLSAPAEVVVEKDSVTVRPTGTGKAAQLEKLLHQICSEDGPEAPNRWLMSDTLVVCIGDFLMRDEDIFATVKTYFEPEGGDAYSANDQASLWTDGQPMLPDHREPLRAEAINLEANSMSLGTGFRFEATSRLDDSPFGILKGDCAFEAAPGIPKKTPSEPDLQVGEPDSHADRLLEDEAETLRGGPALFTCTVNRKATRASYHLSDTNDVAFLIAQLAREIKQAKQGLPARESPEVSAADPATSREARRGGGEQRTANDHGRGPPSRGELRIPALPSRSESGSGYTGLASLFETI